MSGVETRVLVECSVCGIRYDVSARSYRDIKAGRVTPRCIIHRRRRRAATIRAEHRRFWLDRFTLDEINEMAAALWPRPSQRGPMSDGVLLASADRDDDS